MFGATVVSVREVISIDPPSDERVGYGHRMHTAHGHLGVDTGDAS
jgi:hypothetical protein